MTNKITKTEPSTTPDAQTEDVVVIARSPLSALHTRYKHLEELAAVFAEAEKALARAS